MYETANLARDIIDARFFNNSFVLLKFFKKLGADPINQMLKETVRDSGVWKNIPSSLPPKARAFKVVTSLENQMVSPNQRLLKELESRIARASGLPFRHEEYATEFWLLARREGVGFFGVRMTYPRPEDVHLAKGQLRPQLAYILCLLSEPDRRDVFLDPFAGSGAIALERARSFVFQKIIVAEKDAHLAKRLKAKVAKVYKKEKFEILQSDALQLAIASASIDKVVTDPPWGIFKTLELPPTEFYRRMLQELERVLRLKGIAVLLIGDKNPFLEAMRQVWKFEQISQYSILVSGKKATIYTLRKTL